VVGARRAVERWTPMRNLESRSAAWPLGMELDRLLMLGTASRHPAGPRGYAPFRNGGAEWRRATRRGWVACC
jgi:hypothetical protein